MHKSNLILIQGLFASTEAEAPLSAGARRASAFGAHSDVLGVRDYEWVDGHGKALANRGLRIARGTALAVDAMEIIELDEATFRTSLVEDVTRALWREIASCTPNEFDTSSSFTLIGAPLQLLEGPARGQRVLWFGHGLSQLSKAEFVAHYTGHHGPLVAGHAALLGLRRYRQVPNEEEILCDALHELGFGQANAPAVFAELYMGLPSLNPARLLARRSATREIQIDENCHIDFPRSMLLLA